MLDCRTVTGSLRGWKKQRTSSGILNIFPLVLQDIVDCRRNRHHIRRNISLKGMRGWPIVISVILARVHRHSASLESQNMNFDRIGLSGEPTACCYTKPCNVCKWSVSLCVTLAIFLSPKYRKEASVAIGGSVISAESIHVLYISPEIPKTSYRFKGGRLQERIGLILPNFLCLETILCSLWFSGTRRG